MPMLRWVPQAGMPMLRWVPQAGMPMPHWFLTARQVPTSGRAAAVVEKLVPIQTLGGRVGDSTLPSPAAFLSLRHLSFYALPFFYSPIPRPHPLFLLYFLPCIRCVPLLKSPLRDSNF